MTLPHNKNAREQSSGIFTCDKKCETASSLAITKPRGNKETETETSGEKEQASLSSCGAVSMEMKENTTAAKSKDVWKRVDDEHPLLETASTSGSAFSTSTAAQSRPSIDAALLLQSAARSVLDSDGVTSPSNASDTSSRQGSPATPAALSSLQKERLPAMPDEQDRKRFIGCLAAVLASSYDFDVLDKYNDGKEDAFEAESLAFYEEDEDAPVLRNRQQPQTIEGTVSGGLQSADSFGDYSTTSATSSNTNGGRRRLDRVHLSKKLHRKRRYDVLSRLLLSSAEYLLLEKHHAKAFLPMLARLLAPQPKNSSQSLTSPSKKKARDENSFISQSTDPNVLAAIGDVAIDDFESRESDIVNRLIDEIDHLRPFLESMTPGGGFRCLALVLLQHLMQSQEGYDARVRQALKTLGVIILYRDMSLDYTSDITSDVQSQSTDLLTLATRRFECLEHCIAAALLEISKQQQKMAGRKSAKARNGAGDSRGYSREQIVRGIKVGAMGMAAAGLFAVTGGLAAPGIAAGVAAIPGLAASAAAATTVLTSTAAVTAIFGVGGGTLVAYKMNRRTMGLTEFEFRKETGQKTEKSQEKDTPVEAELFTTICISGWLRDECDFQRPWGVSPANPWIKDRQELLERFYTIYRPDHVIKSKKILTSWEGEEEELWRLLRQKYGRDPDHLFPLSGGPREDGALTLDQTEVVNQLFVELGYIVTDKKKLPSNKIHFGWGRRNAGPVESTDKRESKEVVYSSMDSLHGPHFNAAGSATGISSVSSSGFDAGVGSSSNNLEDSEDPAEQIPKHVATVWDYRSHYGGELYTVRWESELLEDLCESVKDLAYDIVHRGTHQLLKHTALSALLSAIAWPAVLVNAANMIDGTWTLAVERADEAGKELARSLLFSRAGHRPVTLVGFSFGARAIYSCLKEMAKYQEKWNKYQEQKSVKGRYSKRTDGDENDSLEYIRDPASIIEDVVIMGLPNHLSIASWKACRQVVSGRLVNCFSQKDLILSLMFQFKRLGLKPVCGTLPVSVPGVENFDVSDLVTGHQDYCTATGEILKRVRLGEPFRSKPTRVFDPELSSNDGEHNKFDL
eukprot:scaffold1953_cov176-Amphora_coffeaeformis.AAC.27